MVYRDSSGHALTDYPRPSVAVDTAVLTVPSGGPLSVLLLRDRDERDWRLPGTFLHEGETLAEAVARSLAEKGHVHGLAPRQLRVFDDPRRDQRGRVLSVAHMTVVRVDGLVLESDDVRLAPADRPGPVAFDHAEMIRVAAAALRAEYRHRPDPGRLLREPFRMRELRAIHEAIAGHALQPDTFRRTMLPGLQATGTVARGGRGKPAQLFERL